DAHVGIGIGIGPVFGNAKHFFRDVVANVVVGNNRNTYVAIHGFLVPGFVDAVALEGARFQGDVHVVWRRDGTQMNGVELATGVAFVACVVAGLDASGSETIAQFIVVGRNGKHHAHVKAAAAVAKTLYHGLERFRRNWMHRFSIFVRNMFFHFLPHIIGDG